MKTLRMFFLIAMCVMSAKTIFAMEPLQFKDPSMETAWEGMRTMQDSYWSQLARRINALTPGAKYIDNAFYSTQGGKIRSRYFYSFYQGPMVETKDSQDLAIEGKGFFVVETKIGQAYTRDGRVDRDADGFLRTRSGFRIHGEDGFIQLPSLEFVVDREGKIFSKGDFVGIIKIVNFIDQANVFSFNDSLFYTDDGNVTLVLDPASYFIRQGYVEMPNQELSRKDRLISHMYDSNANIFTHSVKMIRKAMTLSKE